VAKPVDPAQLYAAMLRWLPAPAAPPPPAIKPSDAALRQRLAAVPGFDLDGALRHLGGNTVLLARVLGRFVSVHAQGLPALADAGVADPRPAWRAACHSLRGAAATVGASGMLTRLGPFEQALHAPLGTAELTGLARALDAELASASALLGTALQG
jgi:HPt (histidine-containing phosphotransfer) domain-containing protein